MKVFNSENLHGTRKHVRSNIFKMFGFALFLFATPLTMFFDIWFCINESFNLDETALPISALLYCSQLFLVFITLIFQNRLITATLQRMNGIVAKSIQRLNFYILTQWLILLVDLLWIGYETTPTIFKHYQKIEKQHALITVIAKKGLFILLIVTYSIPAMFPVLYLVTHRPTPDQWIAAFGFLWASSSIKTKNVEL